MDTIGSSNGAIISRIAGLEEELASIKSQVALTQPRSRLLHYFRRFARFIQSYWVLLSFAFAAATALYVRYAFDIDYFGQYRDQSTTKRLSELYRELGDRMLARTEWQAAANAYSRAIQINPHNALATSSLVKAEVFLPDVQEKFAAPEVIDVKLQYLEELFPNDFMVLFLKGARSWQTGDFKAAQNSLTQSIASNPNFAGGYLQLGYIDTLLFDLDGALTNYGKAFTLDPQNAKAHNNLGYTLLLFDRYQEAIEHFSRANSISPNFLSSINLGDAYRYMGDPDRASQVHAATIQYVSSAEDNRDIESEWTYNFMPLAKGDRETIKYYVFARTRDQKLAIAYFALGLDYAMAGHISEANKQLDTAVRLEGQLAYKQFYANKIAYMERLPNLDDRIEKWLAERRAKLSLTELPLGHPAEDQRK